MKNTIILLIVLLLTIQSHAQSLSDGLNLGAKFGASQLMGEISPNVSGMIKEFDNSFSPSYDIEISKYLSNHWEVGAEFGLTLLKGETDNPDFSAEGWHYSMRDPIDDPVEYENKLIYQRFFTSYYLKGLSPNNGLNINPFLRAGVGHLLYKSKLKYIDAPDDELIFGKGVGTYRNEILTTAIYFAGAGMKASLSDKLFLLTSATFNYVTHDFLDVVYNYTEDGERINANGLYAEFKVGIFYCFGDFSGGSNKKSRKNKSKGKTGKATNAHLPYAPKM